MADGQLGLPDGALLLHIGPHKTGTTAIQAALANGRPQLLRHGVVYPGRERQHYMAALALTGAKGLSGDPDASPRYWQRLLTDVKHAGSRRVVISSEFFCDADEATARRMVADLGGPRVHVLITLRPLGLILPSAWQQYVRNRLRATYAEWLDAMLRRPPYSRPTPSFWRRHHHDQLVERWAKVVGPENVTVVVLDPTDRDLLFRTVEELQNLPAGTLDRTPDRSNRSLTVGETELVRRLNIEFVERGWPDLLYRSFIRKGMVLHLTTSRTPPAEEPTMRTPDWALDRVAEIGAAAAVRIAATGVRVLGDLGQLGVRTVQTREKDPLTATPVQPGVESGELMSVDAAVEAVVGTITAVVGTDAPGERPAVLGAFSAAQLGGVIARRGVGRVRRTVGLSALRRRRLVDPDPQPNAL